MHPLADNSHPLTEYLVSIGTGMRVSLQRYFNCWAMANSIVKKKSSIQPKKLIFVAAGYILDIILIMIQIMNN